MREIAIFGSVYSRRGATQELFIEDFSAAEIAKQFGTPLYVYSANALRHSLKQISSATKDLNGKICVAIKACNNLSILKLLRSEGAGFDVVSGGELRKALEAGGAPESIVFSGVGKKDDEILLALNSKIAMINAESIEEIKRIDEIAKGLNTKAVVCLRVNPNVDAKTHKHLTTGKTENKFGISFERAREIAALAHSLKNLELVGLSCHIGSSIYHLSPFKEAFLAVKNLFVELRAKIPTFSRLDFGGGIGVRYADDITIDLSAYTEILEEAVGGLNVDLYLEPGRFIFANAGVLLSETIFLKKGDNKDFLIVDAAMNDLARPAMYEAYHEIQPVQLLEGRKKSIVDIVGPVCESGDFLGLDREIPETQRGEYIAVMSAGAYGMSMSSNYNLRGRPAEVLIDGSKATLIRRRESYDDITAPERLN